MGVWFYGFAWRWSDGFRIEGCRLLSFFDNEAKEMESEAGGIIYGLGFSCSVALGH
jgi:hypothetical protein